MQTLPDLPDDHDINHLRGALRHCKKFNVAIDAGAHRGIWTRLLCERFDKVIAFEPIEENFERIPDLPNLKKHNLGLGDWEGQFGMSPGEHNTGQWHISFEIGEVRKGCWIAKLDDFYLQPDFIKFDVEGYELYALKGAQKTIEKYQPLVMLELNGLSERYGHTDKDVRLYMESFGYEQIGRWNKDYLYAPSSSS